MLDSWTGIINVVKISVSLQMIYVVSVIPINVSGFCVALDKLIL